MVIVRDKHGVSKPQSKFKITAEAKNKQLVYCLQIKWIQQLVVKPLINIQTMGMSENGAGTCQNI